MELPGSSTLDEMATRIRGEVNAEIFAQVNDRMGEEGRARLQALVAVAEDGYSMFNHLKKPARRATWSRFKAQVAYMAEVDELGDNYEVLVHRFFKMDRAVMFDLAGRPELKATSSDGSVLAALEHAHEYAGKRRDFIPVPPSAEEKDPESGIGFASGNWRRVVCDRKHPGMVDRRHFEAMVFCYLAEELRTGDIAVVGSGEYADWTEHLLPWSECEQKPAAFCAEVGLPDTAEGFVTYLKHLNAATALEVGYADNTDLFIDDGVPRLRRRRASGAPQAVEKPAAAIEVRMPERSLLQIVARTAHWLGWHHCFGSASGSDPKIRDILGRYALAVFTVLDLAA